MRIHFILYKTKWRDHRIFYRGVNNSEVINLILVQICLKSKKSRPFHLHVFSRRLCHETFCWRMDKFAIQKFKFFNVRFYAFQALIWSFNKQVIKKIFPVLNFHNLHIMFMARKYNYIEGLFSNLWNKKPFES